MSIHSKIKKIMEKQNISVREMATMTGLSVETIMRARGDKIRYCTLETLNSIAKALEMDIKELFECDSSY